MESILQGAQQDLPSLVFDPDSLVFGLNSEPSEDEAEILKAIQVGFAKQALNNILFISFFLCSIYLFFCLHICAYFFLSALISFPSPFLFLAIYVFFFLSIFTSATLYRMRSTLRWRRWRRTAAASSAFSPCSGINHTLKLH